MTISLQTRTGNTNMAAAVGLLVFQNFWFWYPLTNFISLAFSPTAIIALNKDLQMPQMQIRSNAKPSTFAYPPPLRKLPVLTHAQEMKRLLLVEEQASSLAIHAR